MNDAPYKVSGKRSGPPPLRGPNPQVPPVKLSSGSKKKPIMQVVVQGLRGTKQIARDLMEKKRKNKLKAKEMKTGQGILNLMMVVKWFVLIDLMVSEEQVLLSKVWNLQELNNGLV